MLDKEDIKAIAKKANIVKVAKKRKLKLYRLRQGQYESLCCFHKERTPSLIFTNKKEEDLYHCFGCGKAGNVIQFVQFFDHLPFEEAVIQVAKEIEYPLETNKSELSLLKSKLGRVENESSTEEEIDKDEYNFAISIQLRNLLNSVKGKEVYDKVKQWVDKKLYELDQAIENNEVESFYKKIQESLRDATKKLSKFL